MVSKVVEEILADEGKLELTPLIDVAFLIIIFFMCLPFKTLDGKLQAFLPTNRGHEITPAPPPEQVFIKIHIVGRDEVQRMWGPVARATTVLMPTRVVYRFADGRTTGSLDGVAAYIRRIRAAVTTPSGATLSGIELRGQITAANKVPHKFVVAVLNRFADQGVRDVDFFGTQIPGKRTLDARSFPYPASDR